MFDIAKLDTRTMSEKGMPMQVRNPTTAAPMLDDAGKPVTITLLGRNSEKFRALQREAQQRRADMASRSIPFGADDVKTENFNYLVGTTIGWSFDTMDALPFAFSEDNSRKLWADGRWAWLNAQAIGFILEEGNFFLPG